MAYKVGELKYVPLRDPDDRVVGARKINDIFDLEKRGVYVLTFEGTNVAMEMPYSKVIELIEQQTELALLPEIK